MPHQLSADELTFIDAFGVRQEESGLPRIFGRILGLLVILGEPLSAAEIADLLTISRASVSTNTTLLVNMGVVERVPVSGERTIRFAVRRQPYRHLMGTLISRMQDMARLAAAMAERIERPSAKPALEDLREFYCAMARAFQDADYPPEGESDA